MNLRVVCMHIYMYTCHSVGVEGRRQPSGVGPCHSTFSYTEDMCCMQARFDRGIIDTYVATFVSFVGSGKLNSEC